MVLVGSAIKDYSIEGSDGRIGTVTDLLFDDRTWKVRWLVVDAGSWLAGRKVLIHPSALGRGDSARQQMAVQLTKARVRNGPNIALDEPLSKQLEADLHRYYGWEPAQGDSWFGAVVPVKTAPPAPTFGFPRLRDRRENSLQTLGADPHLRSMNELSGYHVRATDGLIGQIENFIVNDDGWAFRYLIIDTKDWGPGQHVLMSPYAVREIKWTDHEVVLDVAKDRVKASPAWQPFAIEQAFEKRLHGHYDWPGYGW